MKKEIRKPSSKVSKPSNTTQANASDSGSSQEGTVHYLNNSLKSICNQKLPIEYEAVARLDFLGENIALHLYGKRHVLKSVESKKASTHSRVRKGRVIAESEAMTWASVNDISVSRTFVTTDSNLDQVSVASKFLIENKGKEKCQFQFEWQLGVSPSILFAYNPKHSQAEPCASGDLSRDF
ncbi:hypothetical protein [Nostoc favosum]|uniref:Uncharacterized protein n=1 Tax=Nostoc favosum CHAB5714 TaxID=2780399 RepID=A0ABS8I8X3_9NOSO|nr:hypothetical protein [Nostoc favosum]MCC5600635.1 hypothetical protein [Nostoc favosum CHAB5714]